MTSRRARVLLTSGGGVLGFTPNPPPPPPPGGYLGPDLRTYMAQPGDQVYVIPNGTYTAGQLSSAHQHAGTGGPYKGWLILQAQTPGGVTVDLSGGNPYVASKAAMTILNAGDYRIMFVGMKFVNGGVFFVHGVNRLRWWYCTHTFPVTEWVRQFIAAGGKDPLGTVGSYGPNQALPGDAAIANGMPNLFPEWHRTINDAYSETYYHGFYGCDSSDNSYGVGWSVSISDIIGHRGWGNTEILRGAHYGDLGFNYDPNQYYANSADWWHQNNLQTNSLHYGPNRIQDSSFELTSGTGTIFLGGDGGTTVGLDVNRIWSYAISSNALVNGNPTTRGLYLKAKNASCTGTIANHKYFNVQNAIIEEVNGTIIGYNSGTGNGRSGQLPTWTAPDISFPSGISIDANRRLVGPSGGELLANMDVVNHVANPAVIWRTANPVTSWATYFAGNWP